MSNAGLSSTHLDFIHKALLYSDPFISLICELSGISTSFIHIAYLKQECNEPFLLVRL